MNNTNLTNRHWRLMFRTSSVNKSQNSLENNALLNDNGPSRWRFCQSSANHSLIFDVSETRGGGREEEDEGREGEEEEIMIEGRKEREERRY